MDNDEDPKAERDRIRRELFLTAGYLTSKEVAMQPWDRNNPRVMKDELFLRMLVGRQIKHTHHRQGYQPDKQRRSAR